MRTEIGEALEREFDVVMRRSGIEVPADWRAGALAAYREMRGMAAKMRQPRDAESEPAGVFLPQLFLRSR